MKNLLPNGVELMVLVIASILCAGFSFMTAHSEIYFAVFSMPLTIIAALMGVRKHWRALELRQAQTVELETTEVESD